MSVSGCSIRLRVKGESIVVWRWDARQNLFHFLTRQLWITAIVVDPALSAIVAGLLIRRFYVLTGQASTSSVSDEDINPRIVLRQAFILTRTSVGLCQRRVPDRIRVGRFSRFKVHFIVLCGLYPATALPAKLESPLGFDGRMGWKRRDRRYFRLGQWHVGRQWRRDGMITGADASCEGHFGGSV